MIRKKNLLKAGVLLFATLMIISTTAAVANTNDKKQTLFTTDSGLTNPSTTRADVVWDNGIGYKVGMLAAQLYPDDIDAFPADDFQFSKTYEITGVFWQGGYYNTQHAQGNKDYNFDWNITFFTNNASEGGQPGEVYKTYVLPNASITRELWYETSTSWRANYSVTLSPPIKCYANTKYWMTVYGYNLTFPQSGWCRHNASVGGIKLHEAMFKSGAFGFPNWVNCSLPSLLGSPNDFNYQLMGAEAPSPVLEIQSMKGGFGVSAVIKNSGDSDATDITTDIKLDGGLIILGKDTPGTVASITAGSTANIKSKLIFGFGKTVVTVTATCTDSSATMSKNATVLLIFVLGIK